MTTIGLFFGSFNPVHYGHLSIANYFVDNKLVDELWFVVSPQSPFKQDFIIEQKKLKPCINKEKQMMTFDNRVELLKKAIENQSKTHKVCTIEKDLTQPSYTINTLEALSKTYPKKKFILLMGGDQLSKFEQWRDWEKIVESYSIFVYPRSNTDLAHSKPYTIIFANAPRIALSSTEIRKRMSEGKDYSELSPI